MGERTQMLVRLNVHIGDADSGLDESYAVSLHYQWGYGRVMLMDALHFAFALPQESWDFSALDGPKLTRWLEAHATCGGSLNFQHRTKRGIPEYEESCVRDYGMDPFKETMHDVFTHSDNNDGYCELTVSKNRYTGEESTELRLYTTDREPATLADWERRGNGEEYAGGYWQTEFRGMLDAIGCKLVEPDA